MSQKLNFDDALNAAGSWGRYQKLLYALVFLSCIPNTFVALHFVFSQYEPPFHCAMPREFGNFTTKDTDLLNSIVRSVIPEGNSHKLSSCEMYHRNYSQFSVEDWPTELNNSYASKIGCQNGVVYNLNGSVTSAVIEFSMICENDWKTPIATSMYYIGMLIGSLCGTMADRYGRRPVFLIACLLQAISMVFIALAWNFASYCIAIFISGVSGLVNYVVVFVLISEVTRPDKRNFMCVGCALAFPAGYIVIAGTGYFLQQWRWFIAALTIMCVLVYIPNWWLFPESPRWLARKGKVELAMKGLKSIAKINKSKKALAELIQNEDGELLVDNNVAVQGIIETFRVLFRSGLKGRFLISAFAWMVSSMMYFAVSIYSTDFSSNRFLNLLYNGLSEFPACLIGYHCVKWIGRPRSIFYLMLTCGVTSISLPVMSKVSSTAATILAIIGKGSITAVFYVAYIVSTEVIPTLQRSSAMCICSASARVGALFVPYLMYTRKISVFIPNLTMGILAIFCAFGAIFLLPETRGVEVPDSVEEARKNKRFYKFNLTKKFRENNARIYFAVKKVEPNA